MPMRTRARLPLLGLLLGAALAACSDTSGPEDRRVQGLWAMAAVNDGALPYRLSATATESHWLAGGSLRFADTTVADSIAFATYDSLDQVVGVGMSKIPLHYAIHEDGLVLIDGANGALQWVDTAIVVGDTLRLKAHHVVFPSVVTGPEPAATEDYTLLLRYVRVATP